MKAYLNLIVVLGILLAVLTIGVAFKVQDAHIKSIEQTVTQQFEEGQAND